MSLISIHTIQNTCIANNIPFVSFRAPYSNEIITFVQYKSSPAKIKLANLSQIASGFVVSPFQNEGNYCYVIEPDLKFVGTEVDSDMLSLLSGICFEHDNLNDLPESTTVAEFCATVEKAKDVFKNTALTKVVLSRVEVIDQPADFNVTQVFLQLCQNYEHAYIHFVQLPTVGRWLGASPEPLLVKDNDVFSTVSLAGTQLASSSQSGTYTWGQKEQEEQAIVTRFVEQVLIDANLKKITKMPTVTIQAGKLLHLSTPFTFEMNHGQAWPHVINALHPTPSVAGMPRHPATDFIVSNERHSRELYSGLIGDIQSINAMRLYVNLRCMQVLDQHVVFYSGAGITPNSNAQAEWIETTNKLSTMKQLVCKGCV